jgi:phage major head subunit gpT-like protein
MPLNPLYSIEQLPTTSQAAIREFDDRYIAAIGASQPTGWADAHGELVPTAAPMVTFPISQLRTQYKRSTGESHFKKIREKSFDIKAEEFDDGYRARLYDLFTKVFAYRNWQQAPQRMVLAEAQFRHLSIAALLEAGTSTSCVDGANFFSTAHPVNMGDLTVKTVAASPSATWGNYQATPKDVISIANIAAEVTAMMDVPDENGVRLGVMPDTILCPIPKVEGLKNLLAQTFILGAASSATSNGSVSNPYQGRFNVIPVKEFTDVDDWYLMDSKLVAQGLAPWVSLRQTVPQSLSLRTFDESSDFFKTTGDIMMSSHIWYGFGLALPHAIRLVKGL